MIAADPYRPAAIQQLQTLGARLDIPVFTQENIKPPVLVQRGFQHARNSGVSVVIVDTAGRSQMDGQLMDELTAINSSVKANEVILVIDAMIGQEALPIAEGFNQHLPLTGLMLTKMDGDARGGAAISIRSVTGIPIKYLGTGEGLDALESYDPRRLASRILGMGDMIGLIEKAEAAYDQEDAQEQARKMMSGQFTLEDFASQLKQIRKMGPISQILDMIPGGGSQLSKQINPQDAENQLKQVEAIINSMTVQERKKPDILNASRRRRIARGSGLEVQDVNKLIKQFREAQKLIKTVQKSSSRGLSRLFG
jgi:signal recognition particle subunit SRP54